MIRSIFLILPLIALWNTQKSFAESAADLLLQNSTVSTSESRPQADVTLPATELLRSSKLDDAFLVHVFSSVQPRLSEISFEGKMWVQKILNQEWEAASHLLTVMETKLPEEFLDLRKASEIYLLWKLDLVQSSVDTLVRSLMVPSFVKSPSFLALIQAMGNRSDLWIKRYSVMIHPEYSQSLMSLDPKSGALVRDLQAWNMLRKGEEGLSLLEILPFDHAYKIDLTQTVVLSLAKKGDLANAAKIIKTHLEPAIQEKKDPLLLSKHYLNMARLLYQAGAVDGAIQYYSKIPNATPEYLPAREEMIWAFLRKGDVAKLRGEIQSLSSKVFENRFSPEVYLIRAVSNLKLCYFDRVQKDFDIFVKNNQEWAKKITQALESQNTPEPWTKDSYSEIALRRVNRIHAEQEELSQLSLRSVQAALPAVGEQRHWKTLVQSMQSLEQLAKQGVQEEHKRFYRTQRAILQESIRKMQFVKVELLSQFRKMAENKEKDMIIKSSSGVEEASKKQIQSDSKKQMIFKFDGVFWPDELFHLRSVAQSKCLEGNL